jgi:hypothetical protein
MKPTRDPLTLPDDWRERAGAAFAGIGFKEFAWHATYRAAWDECALRARRELVVRIGSLLRAIVSAKDARIRELERDNAHLKAQLEELESAFCR